MRSSSAVVREIPRERDVPPLARAPDFGWHLLGRLGAAFAFIGLFDVLLTWFPAAFGDAEWEFGTVTSSMDSLPVATLGLGLVLGAGVARGKRGLLRGLSIFFVVIGLAIIAAALLYVTEVPLALRAMQDPAMALALKKAIAKTSAQLVLYPLLYIWLGFTAWRHAGHHTNA
jgi:hypothetical protein